MKDSFHFSLVDLITWRQTRQKTLWTFGRRSADPTENPLDIERRSYHHHPRYLLNFEHVLEDPERSQSLKNPKKTTIWLELRCGGPVTRKSIEDDNLARLLTRRLVFDVAEDPYVCSPEKLTNFCDQAQGFTDAPLSIYRIEN